MPKSKRQKAVALTKVKAKGRRHKEGLLDQIREAADEYDHCYTFDYENFRTTHLTQVRQDLAADSRIFMGNNKVMAIALGRDKEESHKENLWKLAKRLSGSCGLLFTDRPKREVKAYFAQLAMGDFARAGMPATVNWTVPRGPVAQFGHEMMDQLTKLGLPVKLEHGILHVVADTKVCQEGDALTPQASQLLKLWGLKTCSFRVSLTAHWHDGVAKAVAPAAAAAPA